ncbi:uncharacterized protein LOC141656606 [Silene latifolia]|uniref:uncharacterized protein LOC141656606 n=1 Tax=Silene latifolia TaxID=37657 RepID=UPI003D76AFEF
MVSVEHQEMYSQLLSYKNLIFQITLSLTLTILLYFISLASFFLNGINTYIHPDDVNPNKPQQSGPKLAIKRPSDQNPNHNLNGFQSLSSRTSSELKQRKKIKEKFEKFEFDENKAQIFRLKLGDPLIQSRLFYDSYSKCFNCFVISCFCLLLHKYLSFDLGDEFDDLGVVKNGSLVPVLISVYGLVRVLVSGFGVFVERSAFKRSERQLGFAFGVLGFFVGLVICLGLCPSVVDFEFSSIDGYGRLVVAGLCGCITGFLYMGAGKNARAFWLGTDQIRCNLSIVSIGWFGQILFYANHLSAGFSSLLWINPFAEIFLKKDNVGMEEADFVKFRLYSLLLTGVLQVLTLRLNVQTFLNEAVLSWYQRLHSSTVPDMDYSRAKVFLHGHYLCLAVLQFFTPAALILLSLGLSQVNGGLFDNFQGICGMLPCSVFVKETAIFLAWWVAFVWFLFSTAYLAIYRRGIMHIS